MTFILILSVIVLFFCFAWYTEWKAKIKRDPTVLQGVLEVVRFQWCSCFPQWHVLSVAVLTLLVVAPKMFCRQWSQLKTNCVISPAHFGHLTEELFRTCFYTNNNRPQSVLFKFNSVLFGRKTRYNVCSDQLESLTGVKKLASSLPTAMSSQTKWREKFDSPTGISGFWDRPEITRLAF